ncbi:hypothetical protein [Kozakia baliensis]|uniref:Uncharacterized protein n=1 Tax=Kozakia baliensis TaxID=153496 RepID=A0A1D8UV96_9PROT|nr:hypothetical protein [Kozakia baliensis]AOX17561.1 hypothetical protein A0U89_10860 [Kozakia baliensis]GBR30975.1 hypothetical protein AA0488_2151 [Kozakia baliensis NRIC 0488]GEL62963.1 hypothetical protein KBA01_02490 [Kozakia baliensis]
MRSSWLAASLILVVALIGWIGVRHEASAELQRGLAHFRANLPPGATFSYDRAYPRLLARGAGFTNARFVNGETIVTASSLTVNNPSGVVSTGLHLSKVHAQDLHIEGDRSVDVKSITLTGLELPAIGADTEPVTGLPDASLLKFRSGKVAQFHLTDSNLGCEAEIAAVTLDNYARHQGGAYSLKDANFHCEHSPIPSLIKIPNASDAMAGHVDDLHGSGIDLALNVERLEQDATPSSDLRSEPQNSDGELSNAWFTQGNLRIDLPHMKNRYSGTDHIVNAHVELDGVRVSRDQQALVPALASGGSAHIVIDSTIDTQTHTAHSTENIDVPTLASMEIMLDLDHLPAGNGAPQAWMNMRIVRMNIGYHDISLIDRLLHHQAEKQQISPEQLREQIALGGAVATAALPGLASIPAYIVNPDGRTIQLALAPPEPMSVLEFGSKYHWRNLQAQPELVQPPALTVDIH